MTRRILDLSVSGKAVLVADQLLQRCRYAAAAPGDHPEPIAPRLLQQAHRVAMSRLPADQKRDGAWETPNPDKWQHLGAQQ